jgi:hypothetical protein
MERSGANTPGNGGQGLGLDAEFQWLATPSPPGRGDGVAGSLSHGERAGVRGDAPSMTRPPLRPRAFAGPAAVRQVPGLLPLLSAFDSIKSG